MRMFCVRVRVCLYLGLRAHACVLVHMRVRVWACASDCAYFAGSPATYIHIKIAYICIRTCTFKKNLERNVGQRRPGVCIVLHQHCLVSRSCTTDTTPCAPIYPIYTSQFLCVRNGRFLSES